MMVELYFRITGAAAMEDLDSALLIVQIALK